MTTAGRPISATPSKSRKGKLPALHLMSGIDLAAICQALSDDALERVRGTLRIFDAKPRTIVVAEIKLRDVAMQVLFAAMLVDALHAALEDAVVAFERVHVHIAVDVFALVVVDLLMLGNTETAAIFVVSRRIRHQPAFLVHVATDDAVHFDATDAIKHH